MRKYHLLLVAIALPFLAVACKRNVPQNNVTDLPDAADVSELDAMGGLAGMATGGMETGGGVAVGTVVETMDAGSYTYVQIDTGTEKIWAAAPVCKVKVGDKLGVSKAMPMRNFKSKTLEREFETVYFVGGFQSPDGAPVAMSGHGAVAQPSSAHTAGGDGIDVGTVERPEGGKTVAEIHAEKADLAGKEIKLRGKVTKYNPNILGKNWLHVQDGTGDAAAKTHDLTITTSATVKKGDTVLVTGKLELDKDFGAGYKYGIIVEDAKVVVE